MWKSLLLINSCKLTLSISSKKMSQFYYVYILIIRLIHCICATELCFILLLNGKKVLGMLYHCHYCEVQALWKILFHSSTAGSSKINLTAAPWLSCHSKNSLLTDNRYFQTHIFSCKRARLSGPLMILAGSFQLRIFCEMNEVICEDWLRMKGNCHTQRLHQKNKGQKTNKTPHNQNAKCLHFEECFCYKNEEMRCIQNKKFQALPRHPQHFFSNQWDLTQLQRAQGAWLIPTQLLGAKNPGGGFINHTDVCLTGFKSNLEEILHPCQSLGNISTGRREQKIQPVRWELCSWIPQNHSVSALKPGVVTAVILFQVIFYLPELDSIRV